ncbi:MAG TPA: hypothetical protein PLP07_09730 [Pyrinomonadaceae bacterium]|nr:hypothetical protein [Chloracidobacterium sp.]MBP9107964.1 hypothetical protein [Pyrinomonadaceae bacterium]MBK7801722.1 hypothetical protein [Chloracidobacterium sp.]MBK9439102.1 hypothetical protein [Chloracidobacterium sp.]MBK9768705.1 hypothetical protein [Chloracidobacterium sp.]
MFDVAEIKYCTTDEKCDIIDDWLEHFFSRSAVAFLRALLLAQRKNGTIYGCKCFGGNGLQVVPMFKNGTIYGTNFGTAYLRRSRRSRSGWDIAGLAKRTAWIDC